jgi:hypothetical protein
MRRRGGLVKPPKELTEKIIAWAISRVSNYIIDALNERNKLTEKPVELKHIKRLIDDFKPYKKRLMSKAFKKSFPIALGKDWYMSQSAFNSRLKELREEGSQFSINALDWGEIKVIIEFGDSHGGVWLGQDFTLKIIIPDYRVQILDGLYYSAQGVYNQIAHTIHHEMVHATQSILSFIKLRRKNYELGLPSLRLQTKTEKYQEPNISSEELIKRHTLNDIEFYANLRTAIDAFKYILQTREIQSLQQKNRVLSFDEKSLLFKSFIGMERGSSSLVQPPDFFCILKRYAPQKWKKAVSEAYVELFR